MAKKTFAGITSKTTLKNPYAKSHEQFIGNPSMQGGKTAKAKADYKKAVKGGAAKATKKLAKDERTVVSVNTRSGSMFNSKSNVTEVASRAAEQKAMAQRIINDKSKTATRAKIVEMNAVKKAKKK